MGAYVEDYTAYESDGLGTVIPVEYWVEDNESYKWNIQDKEFAMLSMNFNSSEFPNYDITTYRERHLINNTTSIDYGGESLAAIVFEDRQTTVYVDNKDNEESYPSSFENHFAEGVGLVKYIINKQDKGLTLSRTYVLQKVISYDEWQNKVK